MVLHLSPTSIPYELRDGQTLLFSANNQSGISGNLSVLAFLSVCISAVDKFLKSAVVPIYQAHISKL